MALQALDWSQPNPTGWATVEATDGTSQWRIVPVPRDVARIHYVGHDADGTVVNSIEAPAYAETAEEARIVVDVLRAGTDHLPGWKEQLEAAGFVRTYPDHPEDNVLSGMWNDIRKSGMFDITVTDRAQTEDRGSRLNVSSTYQADGANSWHNVSNVDGSTPRIMTFDKIGGGRMRTRNGLPEGIDPLKAGVAAAIAIRDARTARGGSFAVPLGGRTKARKRA